MKKKSSVKGYAQRLDDALIKYKTSDEKIAFLEGIQFKRDEK